MRKLVILCLFLCLSGFQISYGQRTIVDDTGETVEIPNKIQRIADAWPAHNMILSMLGYGDRIVATVVTPKMCPWFYKINSSIHKASIVFGVGGAGTSKEKLVMTNPDLIFMPVNLKEAQSLKSLNYPVVQLIFKNFESLKRCVLTTGEILGGEAQNRAQDYVNYLNEHEKNIASKIKDVPQKVRPRVLHLVSIHPYVTNGKGSIMDAWIRKAGGTNVAAKLPGTNREVSAEQILAWNPDIIILAGTKKKISVLEAKSDPVLSHTKAVQNNQVFINPKGMFFWDRYSAEEALQLQWAAKIFYPDLFPKVDILKETIQFYHQFFRYDLTTTDAQKIIEGIVPR